MPSETLAVAALLLALGGALGVRVGLAGVDGAHDAAAGVCFGLLLLTAAGAAGHRPGPIRVRALLAGLLGGLVLCALPLAISLGNDLAALDQADFPIWASVVTFVAVAEEALLRGALFSALVRLRGDLTAVAGTSAAFALMHVPLYGWGVVPLDFVVGLWLGGLRLATGGTTAPATAHVVANLAGWWLR